MIHPDGGEASLLGHHRLQKVQFDNSLQYGHRGPRQVKWTILRWKFRYFKAGLPEQPGAALLGWSRSCFFWSGSGSYSYSTIFYFYGTLRMTIIMTLTMPNCLCLCPGVGVGAGICLELEISKIGGSGNPVLMATAQCAVWNYSSRIE